MRYLITAIIISAIMTVGTIDTAQAKHRRHHTCYVPAWINHGHCRSSLSTCRQYHVRQTICTQELFHARCRTHIEVDMDTGEVLNVTAHCPYERDNPTERG